MTHASFFFSLWKQTPPSILQAHTCCIFTTDGYFPGDTYRWFLYWHQLKAHFFTYSTAYLSVKQTGEQLSLFIHQQTSSSTLLSQLPCIRLYSHLLFLRRAIFHVCSQRHLQHKHTMTEEVRAIKSIKSYFLEIQNIKYCLAFRMM